MEINPSIFNIHNAIKLNKIDELKSLLLNENNINNINRLDKDNLTPLMISILHLNLTAFDLLYKNDNINHEIKNNTEYKEDALIIALKLRRDISLLYKLAFHYNRLNNNEFPYIKIEILDFLFNIIIIHSNNSNNKNLNILLNEIKINNKYTNKSLGKFEDKFIEIYRNLNYIIVKLLEKNTNLNYKTVENNHISNYIVLNSYNVFNLLNKKYDNYNNSDSDNNNNNNNNNNDEYLLNCINLINFNIDSIIIKKYIELLSEYDFSSYDIFINLFNYTNILNMYTFSSFTIEEKGLLLKKYNANILSDTIQDKFKLKKNKKLKKIYKINEITKNKYIVYDLEKKIIYSYIEKINKYQYNCYFKYLYIENYVDLFGYIFYKKLK